MGPRFGETAYISKVNRAKKVKFDAQVSTKELGVGPRAENVSLGMAGEDGAHNSNFSKLPELSSYEAHIRAAG